MHNDHLIALTITVHGAGGSPVARTVAADIVKLGRGPNSHIQLDDTAARMHAVIEAQAIDAVTLIDLGNGTRVNGASVNKCKLKAGDEIQIGDSRLTIDAIMHASEARIANAAAIPPDADNNPFLTAPAMHPFSFAALRDASQLHEEGSYEYRLVSAAPGVPADEIDSDADVVIVEIKWGRNTLQVAHIEGQNSYWIGETEDKALRCDYFVPGDKLGGMRAPLVIAGHAVLLPAAVGTITVGDAPAMSFDEAIAAGKCTPCSELAGAHQLRLTPATTVRMQLDDLVFELRGDKKAKRTATAWTMSALAGGAVAYVLGSLVGHAGLLAAMASFMPPMGVTDEDGLSDDQRYYLLQMTDANAHRERDQQEDEVAAADQPGNEGGTGERHKGAEGSMGDPTSREQNRRAAVEGPADNLDPRMGRMRALEDAQTFGVIGILSSLTANPEAPISPLGWDAALGNDAVSANGNMWADTIGNAHGAGGLGLTGIGEGGGGLGRGYGLDSVGGLGHGAGGGDYLGFGPGGGHGLSGGRLPPRHRVSVPSMRSGETEVGGRIPPEVIQRIVRQNYGRFRACYESALRTDPNLQGRVAVSFMIGRDGTVRAANGGGDLPNGGVISCVASAFMGLTFPQPEGGGVVRVTYPIIFSPAS